MNEVFGLFPIPFMRARATLHEALVARLCEHFTALAAYWSWARIAAIALR